MNSPRRLALLGSTGSIGQSTLEVVSRMADQLRVVGLCAGKNQALLGEQVDRFDPEWAILCDATADGFINTGRTQWHVGPRHIEELVARPNVDVVLNAIVGAAGLRGSVATLRAGKTLALANKETLVCGGELVMTLASTPGAKLLPVDSEHSAIYQILEDRDPATVQRVVLTASGGPFRGRSRRELAQVTPTEALRHPTWTMGRKITIDSATLMNKALEMIEARWLFNLRPEQIDVVVHPESIVHSFVEFVDGSVLAQLSPPDMKLPIQFALTHPRRLAGPARRLDFTALRSLTFEPPDHEVFPALKLGLEVARKGGTAGAALNAANEVAVERFLGGTLPFLSITPAVAAAVAGHSFVPNPTLDQLFAVDRWAREEVSRWQP